MFIATKIAAFLSHLGTNYGTIRLFSSMTFAIWINCPMISICGLAVLISLFEGFSKINTESVQSRFSLQEKFIERTLAKNRGGSVRNFRYLQRKIISCRHLFIKGHNFYVFTLSTPVTFFKLLIDNTTTVLLTF